MPLGQENAVPQEERTLQVFAPNVSCKAHDAFEEECEACWDLAEEVFEEEGSLCSSSSDGSWTEDDQYGPGPVGEEAGPVDEDAIRGMDHDGDGKHD